MRHYQCDSPEAAARVIAALRAAWELPEHIDWRLSARGDSTRARAAGEIDVAAPARKPKRPAKVLASR